MLEKSTEAPCENGCRTVVTERNRYFTGKYMTARDFAGEQDYFLNRHRIHNRLLHGWGIVCGLRVLPHPDPECREDWVVVRAGVAFDCCGREIFLHKDTALAIPVDDLPIVEEGEPETEEEWEAAYTSGLEADDEEEMEADEGYEEEPDDEDGPGEEEAEKGRTPQARRRLPGEPPKPRWPRNGLVVCLRYTEQHIEQVPALYAEGHCDPAHLEANRVREVGVLEVRRLDEMGTDCWRMPGGGWDVACRDDCDEPLPGPAGVCLEPDCPCGDCVPLALLVRRPNARPGEPVFHIDLRGRRHLPTPSQYLTHIAGINWPHGGRVSLQRLRTVMGGGLKVRFNRRILPAMGMRTGVNPHTFWVQYGGIQKMLEFMPTAGADDPHLDEDECTAVYPIHPDYISRRHRDTIAGSIVYITLKCDFILDCHEMPVDGNHLGGRLPSGDGAPGGVFQSWFRVVHSYRPRERD